MTQNKQKQNVEEENESIRLISRTEMHRNARGQVFKTEQSLVEPKTGKVKRKRTKSFDAKGNIIEQVDSVDNTIESVYDEKTEVDLQTNEYSQNDANEFSSSSILPEVAQLSSITSFMSFATMTTSSNALNLWNISRNKQTLADAVSQKGATIQGLANRIGLKSSEFQLWLTFSQTEYILKNGEKINPSELDAETELCGGQQFKIPNIIFCSYFGDEGRHPNWKQRVSELRDILGFSVWEHDNDNWGNGASWTPAASNAPYYHPILNPNGSQTDPGGYYSKMRGMWIEGTDMANPNAAGLPLLNSPRAMNSKSTFILNYASAISQKGLQGFFHYGHGGILDFGTTIYYKRNAFAEETLVGQVAHIGPHVRVNYSSLLAAMPYKLGTVIIYACYGSARDGNDLVSKEGDYVFKAWDGVIFPEETFVHEPMTIHFPNGKQGTNSQ
jgi:hypothetical protein